MDGWEPFKGSEEEVRVPLKTVYIFGASKELPFGCPFPFSLRLEWVKDTSPNCVKGSLKGLRNSQNGALGSIRIEIESKSIATSCRRSPYVRVTDDHMGPFDCMYEVIMINLGHLSWMLPSIDAITSRPEFPYLIRCSNLGFDVMSKVYDV